MIPAARGARIADAPVPVVPGRSCRRRAQAERRVQGSEHGLERVKAWLRRWDRFGARPHGRIGPVLRSNARRTHWYPLASIRWDER